MFRMPKRSRVRKVNPERFEPRRDVGPPTMIYLFIDDHERGKYIVKGMNEAEARSNVESQHGISGGNLRLLKQRRYTASDDRLFFSPEQE